MGAVMARWAIERGAVADPDMSKTCRTPGIAVGEGTRHDGLGIDELECNAADLKRSPLSVSPLPLGS
jgi:hypothetical protein